MSAPDRAGRVLTTVVGTLAESWQELRVHRGRVVLSLVGVTLAVASLAVAVGFGSLAERVTTAINEQIGGRPATYTISGAVAADGGADPEASSALAREIRAAAERYDVRYATEASFMSRSVQFQDGVSEVQGITVDPEWGEVHRLRMASGEWFTESDRDRLAPALVVNRSFLEQLGSPDVRDRPTVRLPGAPTVTAVVIGAYESSRFDDQPMFYQLADSVATSNLRPGPDEETLRAFEVWLPAAGSEALANRIASDAERAIGGALSVEAVRSDIGALVSDDPLAAMRAVIAGVAALLLVLGGLGLLNVSLVSVRQRIREIGVRRGVGATAGRIFVAVLLENVLGTAVAGGIGVVVGAIVLGNDTVRALVTNGVEVAGAAFPLDAALIGVGSAVLVGALAGFLPAVLAVRVKVIDAIRY